MYCYCGAKVILHLARLCPSAHDGQDADQADSDLFSLNCHKELLTSVGSGAVDNVLLKMLCNQDTLEKTTKSRSGIGFKGGERIPH